MAGTPPRNYLIDMDGVPVSGSTMIPINRPASRTRLPTSNSDALRSGSVAYSSLGGIAAGLLHRLRQTVRWLTAWKPTHHDIRFHPT
jgi:hypothetical protein